MGTNMTFLHATASIISGDINWKKTTAEKLSSIFLRSGMSPVFQLLIEIVNVCELD
jgi:hypothetical protein